MEKIRSAIPLGNNFYLLDIKSTSYLSISSFADLQGLTREAEQDRLN